MSWELLEPYQKLVEIYPDLNELSHKQAFIEFLDRMWTKPVTFSALAKAYMEFTTSSDLRFPKLNKIVQEQENKSQGKGTKRTRRRRSRRKGKIVTA